MRNCVSFDEFFSFLHLQVLNTKHNFRNKENICNQNFLLFPQCFQKLSLSGSFDSIPNDKILDLSKLKAFAEEKINVTKEMKFVLGRKENIAGKGKNAGYQHFLFFPQCFKILLSQGC